MFNFYVIYVCGGVPQVDNSGEFKLEWLPEGY